jgi:DNA polymerase III alpha subunit (gram-positive type)
MKNNLLITDTETGGYDETKNPITQITMEVLDPNTFQTLHYFETFVKPYNNLTITPEALTASRVTMQQINNGIDVKLLMKGIFEVFKKANKSGKASTNPYFVGHNFGFDMRFLKYLFVYMKQDLFQWVQEVPFDTLAMMKLQEGDTLKASENQKYTLIACCERMGITLKNAHGSGADVAATKQLFTKLVNQQRNGSNQDVSATNVRATNRESTARNNYFFEF